MRRTTYSPVIAMSARPIESDPEAALRTKLWLDPVAMAGDRAGIDDVCRGNVVPLLLQQGSVRLELDCVQDVQQAFIRMRCGLGQLVEGARLRA